MKRYNMSHIILGFNNYSSLHRLTQENTEYNIWTKWFAQLDEILIFWKLMK